jgi:formate hydrogenlyase subunit 4
MEDTTKKIAAYIVMVLFIMVMLIPGITETFGFTAWALTMVVSAVIVPLVVLISLRYAKDRTEDADPEYMTWRGQTEDEWTEREDPDDFEGETD